MPLLGFASQSKKGVSLSKVSPVQGEVSQLAPSLLKPPLCKGGWRSLHHPCLSPPCAKGGGMPLGMTGGLYAYTTNLQNLQNDSITIPHPLCGSPLCTRGLFIYWCSVGCPRGSQNETPHMGGWCFTAAPFAGRDLFILLDCYSKKGTLS